MKENRKVISLFSGAMGLDLGLKEAGLETVLCQDFEKSCVETIRTNGYEAVEGDVREKTAEELLEKAGMRKGEPFLVCGGPPCQPFSTVGKRLGINDPRGSLFMDFIRIVDGTKPRFILMENVKGLASSPLKSGGKYAEQGEATVLDVVLEEFSKIGYGTAFGILNAVDYGVPQFRERLIIIGSRDGEDVFLPFATHFQVHQNPEYRWRTVGNAFEGIRDEGECAGLSQTRRRYLEMVPEGGNWRDLPEDEIPAALGGAYGSDGGKTGFYRRLSFSEPAPTLTASPVQKSTMMGHPTEPRPLSVREYARLQQFPDDWKFCGTTAEKYRQIGNAVPVGLAKAVGQAITAAADGNSKVNAKRVRKGRKPV